MRENSEGEYSGVGGRVHQGHPIEVATDVSIMTRAGVERILRFAFRLARSRARKLLTVITKSNAQRHAMVMWDEIATPVVMLLEHLGESEAARRVVHAIELVTADSKLHTRDLGGTANTADVTRAVCEQIATTKNKQLAA